MCYLVEKRGNRNISEDQVCVAYFKADSDS